GPGLAHQLGEVVWLLRHEWPHVQGTEIPARLSTGRARFSRLAGSAGPCPPDWKEGYLGRARLSSLPPRPGPSPAAAGACRKPAWRNGNRQNSLTRMRAVRPAATFAAAREPRTARRDMPSFSRSIPARYRVATASVVLAVGLRVLLGPVLGGRVPLLDAL